MVTKLEAVRLPKAAEIVARTLRRKIVTHELQADDPLPPEDQLMAEMAVARTTVREALRILTPPRARPLRQPLHPHVRGGLRRGPHRRRAGAAARTPIGRPLRRGAVGVAAAIANAVFHATGRRIRTVPIGIRDLLDLQPG